MTWRRPRTAICASSRGAGFLGRNRPAPRRSELRYYNYETYSAAHSEEIAGR